MKKRVGFLLFTLVVLAFAGAAFADQSATFTDPTVTVTTATIPAPGGLMQKLIEAVIAGIGVALAALTRFIVLKMDGSRTRQILRVASIAVHYAEDHFGPDTQNGAAKQDEAVKFLKQNFKPIFGRLSDEQAAAYVKAAYTAAFKGLAPLGTPPAAV